MTLDEFRASLTGDSPPKMPLALVALWYDAKGDWHMAHETAQSDEGQNCAWVHAYLHRKEGDISNAGYWYRRSGRPAQSVPLDDEWEQIVATFLRR